MNMTSDEMRRLEANQAWLAGFETPAPGAEAVGRTKALLRQELAQRGRVWRFGPARGFWAAAAMLAISVGLVWQAQVLTAPTSIPSFSRNTAIPMGDPDEAVLSSLAGEVAELGDGASLAVQNALDGLLEDVQDLEAESTTLWDS